MDELELLKQQVDKNTKDIEEIKQVISESWGGTAQPTSLIDTLQEQINNLQDAISITQSQLAQFEVDNVNRYTETNIKSTKLENNKLIITLINKD